MQRLSRAIGVMLFGCLLQLPVLADASNKQRNVILIIGDGMDDTQITIARNYLKGAQGRLLLDALPARGAVQVLTVDEHNPGTPVYVADSANSATAMATGVVTSRGRIGTSAGEDKDLPSITELAKRAGFAIGIVTTASVTDATPASFVTHVSVRGCENPSRMKNAKMFGGLINDCVDDMKSNGGLGSIAEQIADKNIDVIFGGGSKHFSTLAEGSEKTVWDQAGDNNYQLVTKLVMKLKLDRQKKLLGLFAESHLPVRLRGEGGRLAEYSQHDKSSRKQEGKGSVVLPAPMKCEDNPKFSGVPTLKQMTEVALGLLSQRSERGFFLMVESASIDKQSHYRNTCGHIGEVEQLEETLASAQAFAAKHPDTLILVTADHGQAAQITPNGTLFSRAGVPVYSPGQITRVITPEGQIMTVNYATNEFIAEEHTGTTVPLFSNRPVPPMIAQPQLFNLMADYLGLKSL